MIFVLIPVDVYSHTHNKTSTWFHTESGKTLLQTARSISKTKIDFKRTSDFLGNQNKFSPRFWAFEVTIRPPKTTNLSKPNHQYSNIYPLRCNFTQFILSGNCSTCFGWYYHPSSEAQTIVSTAAGICWNSELSVLWVAYATHSTLNPVPTLPR